MIEKAKMGKQLLGRLILILIVVFLAACSDNQPEGVEIIPLPDVTESGSSASFSPPESEPTSLPPSPIPTPTPQLAALVNGRPILLADFEKELARYELAQAELGIEVGADELDYRQLVLEALIERELIHQAAAVHSLTVSPEIVDEKLKKLQESSSEHGSFDDWLIANQWTLEEFRQALEAEMLVEEMVAMVTADVPEAMEQVRVRYIQTDNLDQAQNILAQIQEGGDFATLAQQYSLDQATAPYGGDLGYFARGSLLVPEVETVAFALQLEEISDIITVVDEENGQATYYIVQLIERDPNRQLGADLRYRLLQEAFESWLDAQKAGATVTYLLEG
jgi:hypothetical protein